MKAAAGRLFLKREVGVGDLLTASTIAISLISVLVSWGLDRSLQKSKDANSIRLAAAEVLADLERSQDLYLSLYPQAQSALVEASEIALQGIEPRPQRVQRARDFLWKRVNEIHNAIVLKVIDERLDVGYVRLFSYYSGIRPLYQETLKRMRATDAAMLSDLLRELETRILSFSNSERDTYTATIGNSLRDGASAVESKYRSVFASGLQEAEKFLVERIEASDTALLNPPSTSSR
jgi:hypothetical protein